MKSLVLLFLFMSQNLTYAESAKTDYPRPKLKYDKISFPGGSGKVTIKDTDGEPISAGYRISLEVICSKDQVKKVLLNELEACSYDLVRFNKKTSSVEILYHTANLDSGRVECSVPMTSAHVVSCK